MEETLKLMSRVMPLELWIVYGGFLVFGIVKLILFIITKLQQKFKWVKKKM